VTALASGLTYLLGATLLLTAVGGYALRLGPREGPGDHRRKKPRLGLPFPAASSPFYWPAWREPRAR